MVKLGTFLDDTLRFLQEVMRHKEQIKGQREGHLPF